ncbi:hypothetical protein T4A_5606 [Trichinella pseudospiralis]|uniref:Uncharacterized protein n=1 Tax=Trichinella pseudospiralis TaxID=6337 RepID=A0A0V1ECQ4_TRIPS|nr:hypothetical protein T4A_5606 [Trichinella pseudospiralis]
MASCLVVVFVIGAISLSISSHYCTVVFLLSTQQSFIFRRTSQLYLIGYLCFVHTRDQQLTRADEFNAQILIGQHRLRGRAGRRRRLIERPDAAREGSDSVSIRWRRPCPALLYYCSKEFFLSFFSSLTPPRISLLLAKNKISIQYFIGLPERTSELIPGFGLLAWPAVVNESNDRSQITLVRHLRTKNARYPLKKKFSGCIKSEDKWNKSGGIVFDVNDQAMIQLRFLTINFGQVD